MRSSLFGDYFLLLSVLWQESIIRSYVQLNCSVVVSHAIVIGF